MSLGGNEAGAENSASAFPNRPGVRIVRWAMTRIGVSQLAVSIVLSTIIAFASATFAAAQPKPVSWQANVTAWLSGLEDQTNTYECIAKIRQFSHRNKSASDSISLTFFGIRSDETQISEQTRTRINDIVSRAIPKRFDIRRGENIGRMRPVFDRNNGADKFARQVKELYDSDMFLHIDVSNWGIGLTELKISLLIMNPETGTLCASDEIGSGRRGSMTIDPRTLKRLKNEDFAYIDQIRDLHDLQGALKARILEHMKALHRAPDANVSVLPVVIGSRFRGSNCHINRHIQQNIKTAHTSAADVNRVNQLIRGLRWPGLRFVEHKDGTSPEPAAAPSGYHLKVVTDAPDVEVSRGSSYAAVKVTIEFNQGTYSLATKSYTVSVRRKWLENCSNIGLSLLSYIVASSKDLARHDLELRPALPRFSPGKDFLELDIHVGEPLHLYCWLVADDGTASILFPPKDRPDWPLPRRLKKYQYPQNFFRKNAEGRRQQQVITGSGRSLFSCFSSRSALNPELVRRWSALQNKIIKREQVVEFLEQFRKNEGVRETHAPIDHRGSEEE